MTQPPFRSDNQEVWGVPGHAGGKEIRGDFAWKLGFTYVKHERAEARKAAMMAHQDPGGEETWTLFTDASVPASNGKLVAGAAVVRIKPRAQCAPYTCRAGHSYVLDCVAAERFDDSIRPGPLKGRSAKQRKMGSLEAELSVFLFFPQWL